MSGSETSSGRKMLKRDVHRWSLVALIFNTVVGAGILGLPSKAYAVAGTYCLLALAGACVLIALIGLCLCELSSRYDVTGGPYVYVKDAYGESPAFVVGWLLYASRVLTAATHAALLLAYLTAVMPALADPAWRAAATVLIVGIFTAITLRGSRQSAIANGFFGSLKLLGLGTLALVGLTAASATQLPPSDALEVGSISGAVLLFMFALMGFESATIVAGEIENPQKNLPFAIVAGTAAAASLYGALTLACIALVPNLAGSDQPISELAEALFGRTAGFVAGLGAIVMLLGSLAAGFFLTPRMLLALGATPFLPSSVAAVHPRWHTPHVAVLLSAFLILIFLLFGSFMSVLAMATSSRLLTYVACCGALVKLRAKQDVPPARFRVPGGAAVPLVAAAASLLVLALGASRELPALLGIGALGILVTMKRQSRG